MTDSEVASTEAQLSALAELYNYKTDPFVASLILPRLYLSSHLTARSASELARLGITHIVSVIEEVPNIPVECKKLHICLEDHWDEDILQHLDTTTVFIRSALAENEDNVVLVHCKYGISRSAAVVCAYLIATQNMTATEAISFVARKREIAEPNNGFKRQLGTYAEQCAKEKTLLGRLSAGFAQGVRWWTGGNA